MRAIPSVDLRALFAGLLAMSAISCSKPDSPKTEVRLNETFTSWKWECSVLGAVPLGKTLTPGVGSTADRQGALAANHFERLNIRCKSHFQEGQNMAPTLLTIDANNPSLTYATYIGDDPLLEQFLDPKTTPRFHNWDAVVAPGETRVYWAIVQVPEAIHEVAVGAGPNPSSEYPRVLVHLDP